MGLFSKNWLWNMALYKVSTSFELKDGLTEPIKIYRNKKIRTSKRHIHTTADPFLFVNGDTLYLFYESQAVSEPGKIECISTKDLINFSAKQVVLSENYHLSYPVVFRCEDHIYMIPESSKDKAVHLYIFEQFPTRLRKVKTLLKGNFFDSNIIQHNNIWYLFTTANDTGLEIYYTTDLLTVDFQPHPLNPVSKNPKTNRSGGDIFYLNNTLYRIAQDSSGEYGKNINIVAITELTTHTFDQKVIIENYLQHDQPWNAIGGHHFSIAKFLNHYIIAVDGKEYDYLINKFVSPLFRLL
jgi:hypothetical protein